jgi:hypothetical protein
VKLIQETPGCNYRTDDAAQIYFRGSPSGAPTHIRCSGIGYTLSAHSCAEFNVELAPFELIGVGNFGEGRPCSGSPATKWTGRSHKYGVYKHNRQLLIIESHGGGEQGYFDDHSHAMDDTVHGYSKAMTAFYKNHPEDDDVPLTVLFEWLVFERKSPTEVHNLLTPRSL